MGKWPVLAAAAAVLVVVAATGARVLNRRAVRRVATFSGVVPLPAEVTVDEDIGFAIPAGVTIFVSPHSAEAAAVAAYLADLVGGSVRASAEPAAGSIALLLDPAVTFEEAYELEVTADGVTIRAGGGAGLFYGVQTLRQMVPDGKMTPPVTVPGGRIRDRPRLAYRGLMLDVARHFFSVDDVKRLIDEAAMYKLNHLHLHLSDDQGWRIAIDRWPRLTSYGAGTEVGDGPGGFYTKEDYREIVTYAASRYLTVVPEIDVPGHTNAALASYAELNCGAVAPDRYTGTRVGFSALCPERESTRRFLEDVFGELAELTPGPYLHIGGDEVTELSREEYATIVNRAAGIVAAHGKTVIGWHDIAAAEPSTSAVLQFWGTTPDAPEVEAAVAAGSRVIMSPADRAYLDMKYDASTRIGLSWAGTTSVEDAYGWDPADYLRGVAERAILGVEAALWSETVTTMDDIEYLVFPRLAAIAEIGWSPAATHDWDTFRQRLGAQAARWDALGISFARADGVPWTAG